jgi:short-subunit dehydrogenase
VKIFGARALVTGASGGLGAQIARELDARGAKLVLTARREDALRQLAEELGGEAELQPADLAQPGAAAELAERAGDVDLLVANAALPGSGHLTDFSPEDIDRAIAVNLTAPTQLARALVPGMRERDKGHLVFIGSLNGRVATAGSSLYSATKFGLRGLAWGLREDLHDSEVSASLVSPGFVAEAGMFAETGVELPPGVSLVTPHEVAKAVAIAVEDDKPEINVAPLALRLGARAYELAPGPASAIQRRLGAHEIAGKLARAQAKKR